MRFFFLSEQPTSTCEPRFDLGPSVVCLPAFANTSSPARVGNAAEDSTRLDSTRGFLLRPTLQMQKAIQTAGDFVRFRPSQTWARRGFSKLLVLPFFSFYPGERPLPTAGQEKGQTNRRSPGSIRSEC